MRLRKESKLSKGRGRKSQGVPRGCLPGWEIEEARTSEENKCARNLRS